ncbi:MAG: tRNA 2-thiouridine(34) synthase MnmA [Oscillospiraceae bacterium]
MSKAMIAMSGGVDSSAAALLMQRAGWDCIGVTMKLRSGTEEEANGGKTCCSLTDAEDARSVACRLGIPFYVFNFTEDFAREVMDRFVSEYRAGRTPNPCIECNRYLKFDRLLQRAQLLDCDALVTGHYARVCYDEARGRWLLKKAKNLAKDQSYVLYFLSQEQLAHLRLPLGEFASKAEVRALAEEAGLLNARKADSQDICFVPDGDYVRFLQEYGGVELRPGDFVDPQGRVLGRHRGLEAYTTGQRKGLGVSGGKRLYVLRKNAAEGTVVLGDDAELFTSALVAERVNWLSIPCPDAPVRVTAKTRYSQTEAAATVEPLGEDRVRVVFDTPQRAVTAGQAVVFYQGDEVAGGGTITEV